VKRTKLRRKLPKSQQDSEDTVRAIVIKRDGGCIMRDNPHAPPCNGYRADGELLLQADHLFTRPTTRPILRLPGASRLEEMVREEYDAMASTIISPQRVALWKRWRTAAPGTTWHLRLEAATYRSKEGASGNSRIEGLQISIGFSFSIATMPQFARPILCLMPALHPVKIASAALFCTSMY
jgi:hypothetical protein